MRILLIEGDSAARQAIETMLKSEHTFRVDAVADADEGLAWAKTYDYDIVLTELAFRNGCGFEMLKLMRLGKIKTPVLVLSGLSGIAEKSRALGIGADDYMTKPFHRDELIARIHSIVRRSKGHAHSLVEIGDLQINIDQKTIEVGGVRVHLTGKEYLILEAMALRPGGTITKDNLLSHLYGGRDEPELKIIDVFVCKLRKKLQRAMPEKNYIQTIWGRGYTLQESSAEPMRVKAVA